MDKVNANGEKIQHSDNMLALTSSLVDIKFKSKGGGRDAVDFRTQTKIKIYSFNFKDPSFLFCFLVPNINKYIRLPLNGSK